MDQDHSPQNPSGLLAVDGPDPLDVCTHDICKRFKDYA
jgi:hypothetical protein